MATYTCRPLFRRIAVEYDMVVIGGTQVSVYLLDRDGSVYDIDLDRYQPKPERYSMEAAARDILRKASAHFPELLELVEGHSPSRDT